MNLDWQDFKQTTLSLHEKIQAYDIKSAKLVIFVNLSDFGDIVNHYSKKLRNWRIRNCKINYTRWLGCHFVIKLKMSSFLIINLCRKLEYWFPFQYNLTFTEFLVFSFNTTHTRHIHFYITCSHLTKCLTFIDATQIEVHPIINFISKPNMLYWKL